MKMVILKFDSKFSQIYLECEENKIGKKSFIKVNL